VRRTVEELETAGICAMSIEDTVLPRPYGANGKPSLNSVEEGVGKMKAAPSARQDKNLVIAGRTSALGRLSLSNLSRTWAHISGAHDTGAHVQVGTAAQGAHLIRRVLADGFPLRLFRHAIVAFCELLGYHPRFFPASPTSARGRPTTWLACLPPDWSAHQFKL